LLAGSPWLGIQISGGNIACSGLSGCDGQPLWMDGTVFNATYFTSISDIQIQIGHQCAFLNENQVSLFSKAAKLLACIQNYYSKPILLFRYLGIPIVMG
jgi:hypothetical protein